MRLIMSVEFIIWSRKNHMNAFVKTNAFSFIGWEEIYSEKRKSIWSLNEISFPATFDFAALSAVFDESGVMSIINYVLFQNYLNVVLISKTIFDDKEKSLEQSESHSLPAKASNLTMRSHGIPGPGDKCNTMLHKEMYHYGPYNTIHGIPIPYANWTL